MWLDQYKIGWIGLIDVTCFCWIKCGYIIGWRHPSGRLRYKSAAGIHCRRVWGRVDFPSIANRVIHVLSTCTKVVTAHIASQTLCIRCVLIGSNTNSFERRFTGVWLLESVVPITSSRCTSCPINIL